MARIEIARLEEQTAIGGGASAMIVLGLVGLFLAIMLESSAVRLTAWAAIWTGWNVLALISALVSTRRVYIVTRDDPQADGRN